MTAECRRYGCPCIPCWWYRPRFGTALAVAREQLYLHRARTKRPLPTRHQHTCGAGARGWIHIASVRRAGIIVDVVEMSGIS